MHVACLRVNLIPGIHSADRTDLLGRTLELSLPLSANKSVLLGANVPAAHKCP